MNTDPALRRASRQISIKAAAFLSGAALFLSGCGGSQSQTVSRSAANPQGHTEKFEFDSLGSKLSKGGSSIIRVYPGVKDTDKDNSTAGTYANGQTAEAGCIADGRDVHSVPGEGEIPRSSDRWLKIINSGSSEPTFATVVYTNPAQAPALAKLPECVNPG
jgi:hypothetical protein